MSVQQSMDGSLGNLSSNSVERFIAELKVAEILASKFENGISLYEVKWANSWLDEKTLKEIFSGASALIEEFSVLKQTNQDTESQLNSSQDVTTCDQITTTDHIPPDTKVLDDSNEVDSIPGEEVIKGTLYMCDLCSVAFNSHESLSAHKVVCPGLNQLSGPFSSNSNEYRGLSLTKMNKIKNEWVSSNCIVGNVCIYECENCSMTFADEEYLLRHKVRCKNHTFSEFRCTVCHRGFTTKGSLDLHVSAVHLKKKDFGCSICGKLFSRKHILKLHIATHYGERNFQCSTCGKTFVQKSNLSRHERIHESKNFGYKCRYCGQTFTQNKHVQKHVSTFHSERLNL